MYENLIIQKSLLFTHGNTYYLLSESEEIKFLPDYSFEEFNEGNITDDSLCNLPIEIREQIKSEILNQEMEFGYCDYTIAIIIPKEKVSDFSTKLKAHLKEKLEEIIKAHFISDGDLYTDIPDLFQNLAALQVIDQSIKFDDLFPLVKEIDKFAILSSQVFFY